MLLFTENSILSCISCSGLIYLQETDGVFVKALRCVVENALQRPLDDTACSQNALAQLYKTLPDLERKHTMSVSIRYIKLVYWTHLCDCLSVLMNVQKKKVMIPLIQIFHFCHG